MSIILLQKEIEFENYLNSQLIALKKMTKTQARKKAMKDLINVGLLNKNGIPKKHIVNECHLG